MRDSFKTFPLDSKNLKAYREWYLSIVSDLQKRKREYRKTVVSMDELGID